MNAVSPLVEPALTAFQALLERRREDLSLTWEQLAERCGRDPETGRQLLPYSTARRLIKEEVGFIHEGHLDALARGLKFNPAWLKKAMIRFHLGWRLFEEETDDETITVAIDAVKEASPELRRAIVAMVVAARREELE